MKLNVITTPMNIKGKEFVLAEVSRGLGKIGVFRYASTSNSAIDVFYVEDEPVINILTPNVGKPTADKVIQQMSGTEKCSDFVKARIDSVAENYYHYNQGLIRSAMPVLELLNYGLYVVHETQMHPCDGSGNYFWNAYSHQREILGTAEKNVSVGDDGNYSPCFLLPTLQAGNYQVKKLAAVNETYIDDKRQLAGVAYHVSGMFSALLQGHHAATASLLGDATFRCLVIEPLTGVIYEPEKGRFKRTDDEKNRKIIALSCPFVNIPLEELPENALERFLITRRNIKPDTFPDIKTKMSKVARMVSRKAFPETVYTMSEQLPDCSMVEAASVVSVLDEEQVTALSEGLVKLTPPPPPSPEESGEDAMEKYDELVNSSRYKDYIISSNYYSSVVAACDYLQTHNFDRYVSFAIEVLKNEKLSTVHKYVSERLLKTKHPVIAEFFAEVAKQPVPVKSGKKGEGIIGEVARKYTVAWEEHENKRHEDEENYFRARRRKSENLQTLAESKGIVTLEMAVRDIGKLPKGATG